MNLSDKRVKLLFAAFAASLLIVILPLNASAQTTVASVSEAPAVSNLYKYLHHVNVTESIWWQGNYNASFVNFNPYSSGPTSNHILWIGKARPYEGLSSMPAIVNGKVMVVTSSGHSIYDPGRVLYAFDQNTGNIIWSYPGLSSAIVIDEGHMLCGTTMINPDTGEFLYTIPRSISIYVPELKMGFTISSNRVMGIDFSDVTNPTTSWTGLQYERNAWLAYDNGKVFFGGRNMYNLVAADARTGNVLWDVNIPEFVIGAAAGYGKLYAMGWTGGICMDQNTGQILWTVPNHSRELGGYALAYEKLYVIESDISLYCLDAHTGGVVWEYKQYRQTPFPAGPADESLENMGYTSAPVVAGGYVYLKTLGHTSYARWLPPNWVSEDGTMRNPYNYEVLAQPGTGEFACLDAESGSLVWKCGVDEIGSPGPTFGPETGNVVNNNMPAIADGRVYAPQNTYSGHFSTIRALDLEIPLEQLINYEWFPPYVYCFGKGPTQLTDVIVDNSEVKYGESLTISGKLVDLSPAIDHISSLSTYTRAVGDPAPDVPVQLSFMNPNGDVVPFATVGTDKDGKFSYMWYPWETGSLQILVESAGSEAYEAPEMTYTTVSVAPVVPDLVPILEFAVALAVIMAIALPVIVYIRKPKQ